MLQTNGTLLDRDWAEFSTTMIFFSAFLLTARRTFMTVTAGLLRGEVHSGM